LLTVFLPEFVFHDFSAWRMGQRFAKFKREENGPILLKLKAGGLPHKSVQIRILDPSETASRTCRILIYA
jgi:hypothetical protein